MQRRPTGRDGWLVQFTLKMTRWSRSIVGLKPLHQGVQFLPQDLGQAVGEPVRLVMPCKFRLVPQISTC